MPITQYFTTWSSLLLLYTGPWNTSSILSTNDSKGHFIIDIKILWSWTYWVMSATIQHRCLESRSLRLYFSGSRDHVLRFGNRAVRDLRCLLAPLLEFSRLWFTLPFNRILGIILSFRCSTWPIHWSFRTLILMSASSFPFAVHSH